ncbi:MAG: V-type ATPase subunit [Leptospirales bacterium]
MNYSYLIARLRARKSELFQKKEYENIMAAQTVVQMRDFLRVSSYGPYIEAASLRYPDPEETILYALRQHTIKLFQFIWTHKPKNDEQSIKFLFSKWELFNLKTILRGIHKGVHADILKEKLIPAGEFTERRLNDLSVQPDLASVVSYLISAGSPYGRGLEQCMEHFEKSGHFRDLEIDLDRFVFFYFQSKLKKRGESGKATSGLGRLRIDIVNILTLMKNIGEIQVDSQHTMIKHKVREEQFIEGGGRLKKEKFLDLLKGTSLDELLRKLSDVLRDPKFSEFLLDTDPDDLTLTEERFEDFIEKFLFRHALQDPSGFYFTSSFLYMKMREVKNLRLILSSVKYKLNIDDVRSHLFYPLVDSEKRSA